MSGPVRCAGGAPSRVLIPIQFVVAWVAGDDIRVGAAIHSIDSKYGDSISGRWLERSLNPGVIAILERDEASGPVIRYILPGSEHVHFSIAIEIREAHIMRT
jgi:hypothetical protein